MQQRRQQTAGSGTKVQNAQCHAPVGPRRQNGFNNRFGIGARNQDIWCHLKFQAPEFTRAGQMRDGATGLAARGQIHCRRHDIVPDQSVRLQPEMIGIR